MTQLWRRACVCIWVCVCGGCTDELTEHSPLSKLYLFISAQGLKRFVQLTYITAWCWASWATGLLDTDMMRVFRNRDNGRSISATGPDHYWNTTESLDWVALNLTTEAHYVKLYNLVAQSKLNYFHIIKLDCQGQREPSFCWFVDNKWSHYCLLLSAWLHVSSLIASQPKCLSFSHSHVQSFNNENWAISHGCDDGRILAWIKHID